MSVEQHVPEPLDLDAIEARATAARGDDDAWMNTCVARGPHYVVERNWLDTGERPVAEVRTHAAAEHIAGMDPATTLALVGEARRPREVRALPDREAIARAIFAEGVDEQGAAAWDTPGTAGRARWYAYADAVLALFGQEGQR